MIARIALVGVGLALVVAACNTGGTTNPPNGTLEACPANITIGPGFVYSKPACKIPVGGKVTIQAEGGHPLVGVAATGNPIPTTATTTSTQFTFTTAGKFEYFCQIHGSATGGMKGSITVE